MKKITSISLENYRAFYGKYELIILPNGENVLIYGENGSGKSSLFKALRDFLTRSNSSSPAFIPHLHSGSIQGEVKVAFMDIDPASGGVIAGSTTEHLLNERGFQNKQPFIQSADLIKGFLDYRRLLDVYYHKEDRPNLFNFIVENLLENYFITGSRNTIGGTWHSIQKGLFKTYHRNDSVHKKAVRDLPVFESNLRTALDAIFVTLNSFLQNYFNSGLSVQYYLAPMSFSRPRKKSDWAVVKELRFNVTFNGINLQGYSDTLNEARMSALAISLYLAAQKNVAQAVPYKVIFLDDVFIGLDSSNRIPLVKILESEFSDYQLFITTYDRHWFELGRGIFKNSTNTRWKFFEFYSRPDSAGGNTFDKPLLVTTDNDFDKAVRYLHHETAPDYPAAANYFRKSAETLLLNCLPEHEIREEDFSKIENYKLTDLIKCARNFFDKINDSIGLTLISTLDSYRSSLLHPLSHSNLASPIYKAEMQEVEKVIPELQLHFDRIKDSYRPFITKLEKYDLSFQVQATHTGHFKLRAEETHYLYKDANGAIQLSTGKCRCRASFDIKNGTKDKTRTHSSDDPTYVYTSFENSYTSIINYLRSQAETAHLTPVANPLTELIYTPRGGNPITIESHKAAMAW